MLAHQCDMGLPPRYRWTDGAGYGLMVQHLGLTKRELEQRIAAEFAYLQGTKPRPKLVTPELQRKADRIVSKILKRRDARPDGPVAG